MSVPRDSQPGADPALLERAVAHLDPIVALMSLIHITGDQTLLHRYAPKLEGTQAQLREAFVNFGGGAEPKVADPAIVAEIRDRLLSELRTGRTPQLREPTPALFRAMCKLALGQELPEASIEPARQHGGFVQDTRIEPQLRLPPPDFHVLVIGAGMIGINAALKLRQAGFAYTVLERRDEIGGTWSVNRYPGAAVDTPSILYSYSFDPNPSWTKYYPMKDEFLEYLERVADSHGINDNIHLNTEVTGLKWDESLQRWIVDARRDGAAHRYEANAVIMSVGILSRARWPDLRDREKFAGPVLHSAEWDTTVDLAGKRVVIVGTGCSGVQLTRAISEYAAHVTTVQRQPDYIIPNPQALAPVPELDRWAMEHIPYVTQWKRMIALASAMSDMKGMWQFDEEWHAKTGGFAPINDAMTEMSLGYLKSHFPNDPEMVRKLTPPYPMFGKRPILDCGYYDALKRPNVDLVEGELAALDETAAILADGTRIECDAIALATGFTLDWYSGMDVRGRGGISLQDAFKPYPRAYQSMLVPGFPNLFLTAGPNCTLTANHAVLGEQHIHYVIEVLQMMLNRNIAAVEVTPEALDREYAQLDPILEKTAWALPSKAHGYYKQPGTGGRVVLARPLHNSMIWHDTRRPRLEDMRTTPGDPAEAPVQPSLEPLSI